MLVLVLYCAVLYCKHSSSAMRCRCPGQRLWAGFLHAAHQVVEQRVCCVACRVRQPTVDKLRERCGVAGHAWPRRDIVPEIARDVSRTLSRKYPENAEYAVTTANESSGGRKPAVYCNFCRKVQDCSTVYEICLYCTTQYCTVVYRTYCTVHVEVH
jgi:hypothetical protein